MTWVIDGCLRSVSLEVTAKGDRRIWGSGRSTVDAWEHDLKSNLFAELSCDPRRDLRQSHILKLNKRSGLRIQWTLCPISHPDASRNDPVNVAAHDSIDSNAVAFRGYGVSGPDLCNIVVADQVFETTYEHFRVLLGCPAANYRITVGTSDGLAVSFASHKVDGGATNPDQWPSKPLLIEPVEICFRFWPANEGDQER